MTETIKPRNGSVKFQWEKRIIRNQFAAFVFSLYCATATLSSSASITADNGAGLVSPGAPMRGTDREYPSPRRMSAQPGSTRSPTVAVKVQEIRPRVGFMLVILIMGTFRPGAHSSRATGIF